MAKSAPATPAPKHNWKITLTMVGILALILVVIVPLALLNGTDDRNRPAADDPRHIGAVFYPQNDADRTTKSDYAFLETCNFKDCTLPVIVLDNTGQSYRYLVNPYFPDSVSISPNGRLGAFVNQDGELYTFFNGAVQVLGGIDKDFAGGMTALRDDGSVVATRIQPSYQTLDPRFYATKDGGLYALPANHGHGQLMACEGELWRFVPKGDPKVGEATGQTEYGYDWAAQTFTPIDRSYPVELNIGRGHHCLGDDKGSFALFQSDRSTDDHLTLWTWTKADGFVPDRPRYGAHRGEAASEVMAFTLDDQHIWAVHHNGQLYTYDRTNGQDTAGPTLADHFDTAQGFINARVAFADGKAYAVGKSKADPERWIGVRYDLGTSQEERVVALPLLTDNYLDRFLGSFVIADGAAFATWFDQQPPA